MLLESMGQLDGGGGFTSAAWTGNPDHAQVVPAFYSVDDLGSSVIQAALIEAQRIPDDGFEFVCAREVVQAGDGVAAADFVPREASLNLG